MVRKKIKKCHDCGVEEGKLHVFHCDIERCPFCERQLLTCNCVYEKLKIIDYFNYPDTNGIPPSIYTNGLTEEQLHKWKAMCDNKGRIPYIDLPNFCRKCLKPYPTMFQVPDEEWARLPKSLQKEMLCYKCYRTIRKWIND